MFILSVPGNADKMYGKSLLAACSSLSPSWYQHLSQWHPLQMATGSMVLLLFNFQSLFKYMNSIDYTALNIYINIMVQAAFQTREVLSSSDLNG